MITDTNTGEKTIFIYNTSPYICLTLKLTTERMALWGAHF